MCSSGASQEIVGCQPDVAVTAEQPIKLVPLALILQDMKDRAAVSDFSEHKEALQVATPPLPCSHLNSPPPSLSPRFPTRTLPPGVQAYTGLEVLLAYDIDFKFGQNYVICLTEAAKTAFLEASAFPLTPLGTLLCRNRSGGGGPRL
jgi:hypothetical protein